MEQFHCDGRYKSYCIHSLSSLIKKIKKNRLAVVLFIFADSAAVSTERVIGFFFLIYDKFEN